MVTRVALPGEGCHQPCSLPRLGCWQTRRRGPTARQHEAVSTERWKQTNTRLSRIEIVLGVIVLLLLVGEGSVIDVLKRLLGG